MEVNILYKSWKGCILMILVSIALASGCVTPEEKPPATTPALTTPAPTTAPPHVQVPPVEIMDGDVCAECGMMIMNPKFASEIVNLHGVAAKFCDIGDMLIYYDKLEDKSIVGAIFVKDYDTDEWVDAKEAHYVTGSDVKTPMMYGIIAFTNHMSAMKFKEAHGGEMLTFDGLKTPMPMEMEGHKEMQM
jgi:copper chaperone NosL